MVYLSLVILLVSIFVIFRSSEWVIRYSITLSRILGISTFVVGFILVAISTSLPEIFVTLFATLEAEANLAVGNILGSNLFDINIVIAITVFLVGAIYVKKKETLDLIELLFIVTIITIIVLYQTHLNVVHGIILISLFGILMAKLYKGGKVEKELLEDGEIPFLPKEREGFLDIFRKPSILMTLLKFFVSVALLLGATKLLVDSSVEIALFLGLTTTFIGATIVAMGTSLPELSVTLAAVRKKHYALAMGDVIGSAVTNITLVLGLLAIINPAPLNVIPITGMLPFMIISTLLVWYSFSHKGKLGKNEGLILLAIYAGFILEQLGFVAFFA